MDNQEIINRIDSIARIDNLCDQILAVKEFEKDYKKSDFYKQTKMPLQKLVLSYKINNFITLDSLVEKIQEKIENFDLTNLSNLLDNVTGSFQSEISDLNNTWSDLQDIKNIMTK